MSPLPLWARALRRIDRLLWLAYHAHEITRDELLFAWLDPELRPALTVLAYSDLRTYLPGGATFEAGLFGWEEAILADPRVPRAGRVLLAAAGGGRELKALLDRGYAVTAFEPNAVLLEAAQRVASGFPASRVLGGTYQDLTAALVGHGPLAELRAQDFSAVLFGWGSFTHVTDRKTQLAVLRAVRALAPRAPLIVSFFLRKALIAASRSERWRGGVRRALRHAGSTIPFDPGLGYDSGGGFVYSFTDEEIRELAQLAGYRVELQKAEAFPHALLVPV